MATVLDSLVSGFGTEEQEKRYNTWFRGKTSVSLVDGKGVIARNASMRAQLKNCVF